MSRDYVVTNAEKTMPIYADQVFAPLDRDLALERIAGGNETEVYRTDDQRYVIKLKSDHGGTAAVALARALADRAAAERFIACLGPAHTITSFYLSRAIAQVALRYW